MPPHRRPPVPRRRRRAAAIVYVAALALLPGASACGKKDAAVDHYELQTVDGHTLPHTVVDVFEDGSQDEVTFESGSLVLDGKRHSFTIRAHTVSRTCAVPPTDCEAPVDEDPPATGSFRTSGGTITLTFDPQGDPFQVTGTLARDRITIDFTDMGGSVFVFVKTS